MAHYDRVQRGWIWIVLVVMSVVVAGVSAAIPVDEGRVLLWGVSVLMMLLAASMKWLRVRDEGDRVYVGYGPLPVFRRRIDYARITRVERVKAPALLGIGLRWSPGFGWAWNINTGDLVRLHFAERVFHVGSADPDELVALIESRISSR
ncbi:MAG: hypothetical protein DHS20C15_15520 [Planctomycetota bacterium]|nr:MAG: hypothetical protein DHS20C15_15520 [Planctomycetota bacterium]